VPVAYLSGVPPRAQFMLFNWVAFLLAGAAVAPLATGQSRPFTFLALALGVYLFGRFAAPWILQPVPGSTAWRADAPAWFMTRLALHLALTGGLMLLPDLVEPALRWLTLLGRQSLTGYIFSVLLTYGGPAAALGLVKALAFPALGWSMVGMIAITWAACRAWETWLAWEKRRLAAGAASAA